MYKKTPKANVYNISGYKYFIKGKFVRMQNKNFKKRKPVFYTNNHATTLTTFQKRRRCHSILPIQDNKSQIGISKTTSSV